MPKLYGPDPLPMSTEEALALQKLCLMLPANPVIVQIGAYIGASTVAMLSTCQDAFIFSIDIYPHREETVNLIETGLNFHQCQRVLGDSVDIGEFWPIKADMIFIDGDHRYEAIVKDITIWRDKVKPGGILALHDYIPNPQPPIKGNVAKAVNELIRQKPILLVERLIAFQI
jgi:predicted O-methyltransferase YrrM